MAVALTALPLAGVVEDVCVMETWNPEKAASWNQAPKLHYCLDYDRQKAELFVTRLEGTAGGMGGPASGGAGVSTPTDSPKARSSVQRFSFCFW